MLEPWFLSSIIACICVGFFGFFQKVKAEKTELSDNGFVFYIYVVFFTSWFIWSLFSASLMDIINLTIVVYAFIIMFLYTIIVKTRLQSLRYLSSSTYFINYRILSSLWLLAIGILIFSETISLQEIIGVFIGFFVFYLLIEKKNNAESDKEFYKGYVYLFIWSLCISGLQSLNKNFMLSDFNIFALMLYSGIFGIFFTFLLKNGERVVDIVRLKDKGHAWLFIISWVTFSIATYTNIYAYRAWDLAVVYKIISYSLFIPIILSIIFYNEKITLKKGVAFALTIFSIFLFI